MPVADGQQMLPHLQRCLQDETRQSNLTTKALCNKGWWGSQPQTSPHDSVCGCGCVDNPAKGNAATTVTLGVRGGERQRGSTVWKVVCAMGLLVFRMQCLPCVATELWLILTCLCF